MKLGRISASILLVVAPLTAQAVAAPQDVAHATQSDASSYTVGPGDVLTVTVYRAPDYAATVEVADDGTIVLNAIGRVKAAGMTTAQVGSEIARRLQTGGIFRDPVVNVLVQTYRSRTVSVLGAVAKPGEYPLDRGGLTITEILARAGATLGVGGGTVRLLHKDGSQQDLAADQVLAGTVMARTFVALRRLAESRRSSSTWMARRSAGSRRTRIISRGRSIST